MAGDKWIAWDQADLSWIQNAPAAKRPPGNQRTKKIRKIKDVLAAWDIESSRLPDLDQSFVYHWQLQLGEDMPTIRGRTLEEFRLFMDRLADQLAKHETLIIYVHNLSYEFHFLRGVYPEIQPEDVFSTAPRKPVKVKLYDQRIEFRCSAILTNMSLDAWTSRMGVQHHKCSSSKYDHSRIRYPWSDLSEEELEYCRNDVLGLVEALRVQLDLHHDTLASIPLTSTGYVRRDVKRTMDNWSSLGIQAVQPSDEVYVALREAFRGGDTHANRYYAGLILEDVGSADRSSSYPDVCVNQMFPMGTLLPSWELSVRHLNKLLRMGRAVLARVRFTNLRLSDPYDPCPYLSYAKIRGVQVRDCRLDNGRILEAPHAETTITDIDWRIIRQHYSWDRLQVLAMWDTRYGFLPDILRALINSYYRDKTELKGVKDQKLFYDLAKALLNSIYGLMAQDPCKENTVYIPDPEPDQELFVIEEGDIKALLEKSRRHPYSSYQWGVWTTAWARWELHRMIDAAGDNFVYCDTDSVKYLGSLDMEDYNREKIRNSRESGASARDPAGKTHFMGVFEDEGRYNRFCTLGAKKYAFEEQDGSLHITVAGVGKKAGAQELMAAGGLEAFKPGMTFTAAGGLEAVYNDRTDMDMEIDGHRLHIGPNVCLRPSSYTLGLTEDYIRLLEDADLTRAVIHERNLRKALMPEG